MRFEVVLGTKEGGIDSEVVQVAWLDLGQSLGVADVESL